MLNMNMIRALYSQRKEYMTQRIKHGPFLFDVMLWTTAMTQMADMRASILSSGKTEADGAEVPYLIRQRMIAVYLIKGIISSGNVGPYWIEIKNASLLADNRM
jgi:hypothetical protein